jgi:AcrR family transcriptional regulator
MSEGLTTQAKRRGRNERQERQRLETRQALVAAAREVFGERGYLEASIEHVLAKAGVSRAAFYSHFDSKLSLVCAVAEDFTPIWRPVFEALGDLHDPTIEALQDWVMRHLAFHREHRAICGVLTQVALLEDRLYWVLAEQRDALIADLARGHPAFARATADPFTALQARLLLWQVDETCFLLVRGRLPDPEGHGPRQMAERLYGFLQHKEGNASCPTSSLSIAPR